MSIHFLKKIIHSRPRLSLTFLLGAVVFFMLPDQWGMMTRALVGWNVAAWSYLVLMAWLMLHAGHDTVRRLAQQEDETAVAVLVIMSFCAAISLVAIVFEFSSMKNAAADVRLLKYLLTVATVSGSWCLLATVFTFHYALLFYGAPTHRRPLRFPDDEALPDYWDFLYFSFTIAVAVQTSDVSVMSRQMRKTVLGQSILSFIFNLAILGFSINIAASVVGN